MEQVLTIDLEDWFHSLSPAPEKWSQFERRAEQSTALLMESLDKYGSRATFFVLGDVAKKHPQLIQQIHNAGHEVGTHGMEHRLVYSQQPREFREDLRKSIDLLESLTGAKVLSYRAPYFSVTNNSLWALDILREEGVSYDSSIFPVLNSRYGIPAARRSPHEIRDGLFEWPISTFPTPFGNLPFAGGVYFRFLAWRCVYVMLRRLQTQGEPILFYLHPWELDTSQPRFRSSSKFLDVRHYWRLGAARGKFEQILKRISFTTLAQGIEELRGRGRI